MRRRPTSHPEGPLDATIRIHPLGGSPLARDYLQGARDARRFFGSGPADLGAFRRKLDEVRGRFGPEERRLAASALRPTSARARSRLDRFVRDGGAVVTTGQQAGLFTGPLYTIYKALTVSRLASTLEAELGTLVLPVFWSGSEDHDWEEVNHAFVLHGDAVRRIDLPPGDRGAVPMFARTLGTDIETTLAHLAQAIAGQPHADRYLSLVRDAYRPGVSVSEAYEALLAELLAPFDLLITAASDPAVKAGSVEILRGALERAPEHEALLSGRTAEIVEAGYHAQVPVLEGATNVFHDGNGARERLYLEGGELVGSETGARMGTTDAAARLRKAPGRFSPNVLLRPVVESAVFPTLAYVAGPGEIAYFAQLSPLFGAYGMVPPVVYPRAAMTIVEPGLDARLAALGFELGDLGRPRHELVETMARRAMPRALREAFERLSRDLSARYREVLDAAIELDPTLAGAIGSIRNDSLSHVGRAERKVVRRLKRLQEERALELDRVRAHLAPGGQPQERVLNVIGFLAAYGPGLLEAMADAIPTPWEAAVR